MFTLNNDYTVLDQLSYFETIEKSRKKVQTILRDLLKKKQQTADEQVAYIVSALLDTPYFAAGATGEGDWVATAPTYQAGAVHVKQDPVYRLDGLDCQTFVQVGMGLLFSQSLSEFDQNILKINYGAVRSDQPDQVHYYNRNNFVEGDWNRVNQQHGWLRDASPALRDYMRTLTLTLNRQNWFAMQTQTMRNTVRVLADANGPAMVQRYTDTCANLNFPNFSSEVIELTYLPKETIAIKQADGSYQANTAVLRDIPTPAIVEIVRDPKTWQIAGKNIKELLGTELSISHMGFLYRQTFKKGELIYLKTSCNYDAAQQKHCSIEPVYSPSDDHTELMFAHATFARPNNYFFYQTKSGQYICSPDAPSDGSKFAPCNRVETIPLFAYLTDYQYGAYWYMDNPALLGIHIEQLIFGE